MQELLGLLWTSRNFSETTPDDFGQATILGIPIQISGGDRMKIKDNVYDLTAEIYKALSSTSYTSKNMKD